MQLLKPPVSFGSSGDFFCRHYYYYLFIFPFPDFCSAAEHTNSKPWRHAISVQRGKAGGSDVPVCQAAAV